MPLFNVSNEWETDVSSEDLCKNFIKEKQAIKKRNKSSKYHTKTVSSAKHNLLKKAINSAINKNDTFNEKLSFCKESPLYDSTSTKSKKLTKIKLPIKTTLDNKGLKIKQLFNASDLKTSFLNREKFEGQPLLKKDKLKKKKTTSPNELNDNKLFNFSDKKSKKNNKKKSTELFHSDTIDTVAQNDDNLVSKKLKLKKIKKKRKNNSNQFLFGNEQTSANNMIDPSLLNIRKKQLTKLKEIILKKNVEAMPKKKKLEAPLTLREKMQGRLKAARFRFLNEQIYTISSKEAQNIFKADPEAFIAYHDGYRQQVKKWPLNPLDSIIRAIQKMPKTFVIADFGCGEAHLAKSVEQKVYSFDLVAANETVTACDMAHVPLNNSSVDVAVFCLSLMGTNLSDYLLEANRVLKEGGLLKIAEVESRFEDINSFIKACEKFGFNKVWMDLSHNLFYFVDLRKVRTTSLKKKKLPDLSLLPCLYKKR